MLALWWAFFVSTALFYEFKEKRVSNALNYLLVLMVFGIAFFEKALSSWFALFVFGSLLFAFVVYALGAWGGGDAKFFVALAGFRAVVKGTDFMAIPLFFISSVFLLVVWLVFSNLGIVLRRWRNFLDCFKAGFYSALLAGVLFLASSFFVRLSWSGVLSALAWAFLLAFGLKTVFVLRETLLEARVLKKGGVTNLGAREAFAFAPFLAVAAGVLTWA